jgi:hypothetical protein
VVLEFAELASKNVSRECSTGFLSSHPLSCKTFPFQSSCRQRNLCFSANSAVIFVTKRGNFSSLPSQFLRIAPKVCNPYHRVEFCGVNPCTGSSFHKVINIHVQNFIAQK